LRLPSEVARLFNESETNGYYFAVWAPNGLMIKSSANKPVTLPVPLRLNNESTKRLRWRGDFREAFRFNGAGECLLAGRSTAEDAEARRSFALILLAAGGAVLAFGLGVSWWLTTRAIKPVEEISAAASRISAGNLSERISVANTGNELDRLAGVLNSTFARLEAAFAQQKQFTADASHELRTPLAVIISETQSTLTRERSAAEYRETVETCLDAAQQMRQLAHSLLELARFDAGQEVFDRRQFDLAEQIHSTVELIQPLARDRGIKISHDLQAAPVVGDANRINQVITNLLTNAIHYNKDRGEIRVVARSEDGSAVVTVSDTGVGISAEDLPHIFERFYRADKSRARAAGQSGLGLAIVEAIVEAHGGKIEVQSEVGKGTAFTVRLPRG
jgi:heavy metal sensor kinase